MEFDANQLRLRRARVIFGEDPNAVRVLVTGSRTWTDRATIKKVLSELPPQCTIIHGGCETGADRIADEVAKELGLRTEVHPARWDEEGRGAGPLRNQRMVDEGADFCLAFRQPGPSRGTDDCVRRAKAAGIEVRMVEPDLTLQGVAQPEAREPLAFEPPAKATGPRRPRL